MNSSSTPLQPCQIRRRYKITEWALREARRTGFIGPVRGPLFIQNGNRFVATQHEMDSYLARQREFDRVYLNSARMTKYINSQYAGVKHEVNRDASRISKLVPYFSIVPPMYYTFQYTRGVKLWHLDDVLLFKRFVDAVLSGRLQRIGHPNYDADERVWRPVYPAPAVFTERYTDETKLRVVG